MLINISGSKSISNRILILKYLSKSNFSIKNLSDSDDTKLLLEALNSDKKEINLGLAGTSIRFLLSYFAIKEGVNVVLTGEDRLKKRPIKYLVDALIKLGADIEYLGDIGFPPLKIKGKKLNNNKIKINASVSSQFISSLLLIAPFLENGLLIELEDDIVSFSYIQTTLNILKEFNVKYELNNNKIHVYRCKLKEIDSYFVESDWSSASYYYSYVSLTNKSIKLGYFLKNSNQADSNLINIYEKYFGVKTYFIDNYILLEKDKKFIKKKHIELDLINNPDIAQTIIINCVGLGIKCTIKGLNTLKIKETDRLKALSIELSKFNVKTVFTDVNFKVSSYDYLNIDNSILIKTYNDHRMAMCFAPLLHINYNIIFDDKNVVTKSYPNFWNDFNLLK